MLKSLLVIAIKTVFQFQVRNLIFENLDEFQTLKLVIGIYCCRIACLVLKQITRENTVITLITGCLKLYFRFYYSKRKLSQGNTGNTRKYKEIVKTMSKQSK